MICLAASFALYNVAVTMQRIVKNKGIDQASPEKRNVYL